MGLPSSIDKSDIAVGPSAPQVATNSPAVTSTAVKTPVVDMNGIVIGSNIGRLIRLQAKVVPTRD